MGLYAKQIDFLLNGFRDPATDEILSGGKVTTKLAGTSTESALWTDRAKSGSAANPIILGTDGTAEVFGDNIYDFYITDSADNPVDTLSGLTYTASPGADTITYNQGDTGAVDQTLEAKLQQFVTVQDFGAVGDGVTDDTVAIQAAIDAVGSYGSVYFPAGQYFVSAPLTITSSYVGLHGDGSGATEILRTDGDYGDTFLIAHATPATNFLLGISIKGIKIRANVEMNSGAHLHLQEVTQSTFEDVFLEDGFIGLFAEGIRNCMFTDFKIESGKYFSTLKSGSRFVRLEDSPNAAQENTECGFTDFNWTFTINATVEYGLQISSCDGLWFSNGHILGGATAECLVSMGGTTQLTGLRFNQVWFDGFTETNVIFSNAPTGSAGIFQFTGCTFSGATTYCVWATTTGSNFAGAQFVGCSFENCDGLGVRINSGISWKFVGCTFHDIDRDDAASAYAIKTEDVAVIESLVVSGCEFGEASTLDYGIMVGRSSTKFTITGNSFENISVNELELVTTAELIGHVAGNSTDRSTPTSIATGASITVPAILESVNITGVAGDVSAFVPRWEGRRMVVIPTDNIQTLKHGVSTLINQSGADVALAVNRSVGYQYNSVGSAWYQVG